MPTLELRCNVPGNRLLATEVIKDLSAAVAKGTGKPESVRPRRSCDSARAHSSHVSLVSRLLACSTCA